MIPKPWTRSSASMSPVAHSGPRRYYDRGPCGIPELDMMNDNMHVKRGNRHLNRPINFDILNTDFDFEANLALFDKDVRWFVCVQHSLNFCLLFV
ncbi:unnamed protein product [Anisakis simplex]|uniref:Catalase n=1 Tax=Anisakis simplex TaxID=6269 RepID=A0A0M3JIT9_ANISI|nr:unnamed protein product [Anisakis simplex]